MSFVSERTGKHDSWRPCKQTRYLDERVARWLLGSLPRRGAARLPRRLGGGRARPPAIAFVAFYARKPAVPGARSRSVLRHPAARQRGDTAAHRGALPGSRPVLFRDARGIGPRLRRRAPV